MDSLIWCVEDDASIRDIETYALRSTGFETRSFEDGTSFWRALQDPQVELPELVLLDVMLPGIDGVELLRRMKSSAATRDVPVIMATAKGSEFDTVQSLDLGADDYLVKPFSMLEMVSRVRVVLRRCRPRAEKGRLEAGDVVVNTEERTVRVSGEPVELTYKEFELLRTFMAHPGIAFTREQLFGDIWHMDYYGGTRTVDAHIRTLRQKLGPAGSMIQTVRNVGYRLDAGARS